MADFECILADGYDREVYARVLARHVQVVRAKERLERLLPHGAHLMRDLFHTLYKLNVVLEPVTAISPAVFLHRRLLEAVIQSRPLFELRKRTELSEAECAAALPSLADTILSALTREYAFNASTLDELARVAEDEAALEAMEAEKKHLEEIPDGAIPEGTQKALEMSLDADIRLLKKKIEKAKAEQTKLAQRLTTEIDDEVERKLHGLPGQIDQAAEAVESLGLGAGSDGRVSAEKRLELGERLMRSKKLQMLARLVGAFREVALEARRKRVIKAPQELHEIHSGSDLEHILPSELLGLSRERRALHLDFLRRYVEGELLEYKLEAAAERGPMVVCVDGSGSMSGSKELWAKAVALTLMEIARREKRRCLAIIFSDGPSLFEVELLAERATANGRARPIDEEVLRFAEHFPGGGTSFEEPLARSLTVVSGEGESGRRYRRGDIVFITDGEASVSPELLTRIAQKKKRHRFTIRGILVDDQGGRQDVLEQFCDDVRRVSDLTGDSVRDLFTAV
jgi:uncharacterized protein with von Willebrand factor type A (vWA) domain